ncbi:unnamed protein product [Trifolium pratense]|uniref:Uncharacterized protein n=1 Tax=Trifolium pratense TaxID=57577 RepID=A0ACB0KBY9_TRIPR|nr:unnamed protein product [Trifolium pratense]
MAMREERIHYSLLVLEVREEEESLRARARGKGRDSRSFIEFSSNPGMRVGSIIVFRFSLEWIFLMEIVPKGFGCYKKTYDPSKTEEEVASVVPDSRVDPDQWRQLVHHWFSEKAQKISKINRQNRAKFEDVHHLGTKSLQIFIDEKKKKRQWSITQT